MARADKVPSDIRTGLTRAIKSTGWPVNIHGPAGTGKTCLAALLYRDWTGKAAWFSCRRLLADLAAWRADPERQAEWLMPSGVILTRPCSNAWRDITSPDWLIVLDDIGTRSLSDTQAEILGDLLDLRIGSPLIVTGNHSREHLSSFMDERIVSRLFSGTVIELGGADLRTPTHEIEVVNNE